MQLLDKLHYLRLLEAPGEPFSPTGDEVGGVLSHAARVWPQLGLKPRKLKPADMAAAFRHGSRSFFHLKAFPRKLPETFVIVVTDGEEGILGHILIDLAADHSQPFFESPSFDFEAAPTPEDIQRLIPQIDPDDDNPFAILTRGEGTYMQTLRTDEGYVLEHQLVNTSSHYEIPAPASAEQVVAAMLSYAFGENEWLESFAWRRQEL